MSSVSQLTYTWGCEFVYADSDAYPVSEMTDSTVQDPRAGKRERLVAAACQVLYEQGVERTTLADIALAADVPVFSWRYQIPALVTMVPAGALGLGVIVELISNRRARSADRPAAPATYPASPSR